MAEHSHVTLTVEKATSPEALELMRRLDAELRRRYPGSPIHGIDPRQLDATGGVFVLARVDDRAVACGAVRPLEPGIGEIKRMYVEPAHRGRGIARAVLGLLESTARELRLSLLRLETGAQQPEAVRLYQSAGYTSIPRFGEYAEDPHSLCYEKRLEG